MTGNETQQLSFLHQSGLAEFLQGREEQGCIVYVRSAEMRYKLTLCAFLNSFVSWPAILRDLKLQYWILFQCNPQQETSNLHTQILNVFFIVQYFPDFCLRLISQINIQIFIFKIYFCAFLCSTTDISHLSLSWKMPDHDQRTGLPSS